MLFGSHAGAAGCVHRDLYFRHKGLKEQGVGCHADIRAKAHKLQFDLFPAGKFLQVRRQGSAAEGGLFIDLCAFKKGSESFVKTSQKVQSLVNI